LYQIKDELYWVGIKDWELESFHGSHYSTRRGATYNSYLIKDQKIALVDAVFHPFTKKFINNLDTTVGLKNIDYLIINHSEIDHAGALDELMKLIPDVPLYCSKKGKSCYLRNIIRTGIL